MDKNKRLLALCISTSVLFSAQAFAASDYVATKVAEAESYPRPKYKDIRSTPFATHEEALKWATTQARGDSGYFYARNLTLLKTGTENGKKYWIYGDSGFSRHATAKESSSMINHILNERVNVPKSPRGVHCRSEIRNSSAPSVKAFFTNDYLGVIDYAHYHINYTTTPSQDSLLNYYAYYWFDLFSSYMQAHTTPIYRMKMKDKCYTWGGGDITHIGRVFLHPTVKIYEVDHIETEEERKEREARERKELAEKEELGDSCGNKNNPVNITTGNKYQPFALPLGKIKIDNTIHYNSKSAVSGLFGKNRTSLLDTHVAITENKAKVQMPDGQILHLDNQGDKWTRIDVTQELVKASDGWVLHDTASQQKLHFNNSGQLTAITQFGKELTKLVYTNGVISQVQDQYGTAIDVQMNNGVVESLSLVGQDNVVGFGYDGKGNLSTITHKSDTYEFKFDDARYPHALTKRLKNGKELGRYGYDDKGLVAYSQVGEETEEENKKTVVSKFVYEFKNNNTTVVTNPLGKKTTYHFKTLRVGNKVEKVEGHKSANCVAANQNYSYYDNGLVKSQTDWLGNKTTFTYYDDRGLEKARTEAEGTPQQRIITTTWHPTFQLPETVTQGNKVTRYTYYDNGQLKNKKLEKKQ
ncbi:DUF6531 domain-containing protein [Spartinivicinus poritis]|uniref:DUF6531 domain-containing protein n=1 Tax=Spartinivicinus poritis TaxID=2994640 RepID=A0ABT5UG22_9GAMM|nr:DUF6531 domain-containing protein [Spartinivicinus sp. A2-2]MDE1465339.1 DUF6531 domain-containing protein [Spartinivicinus sp. A2-2]